MDHNKPIDLMSRRPGLAAKARLQDLKLRVDVEQAKTIVATSLISVLFLATMTNRFMFSKAGSDEHATEKMELSSRGPASLRGQSHSRMEDDLASRLANTSLHETAQVGQFPSVLEQLTIGELEGRYSVHVENGKVGEIRFVEHQNGQDRQPKLISNRSRFIEEHRQLLPVQFEKMVRTDSRRVDHGLYEAYELISSSSVPLAKVEFQLDQGGHLIKMKVVKH